MASAGTRLLLDTALLLLVIIPMPVFYTNVLTPIQRGFFCNDETIHYPDHDSTVTDVMLYVIGIFAGLVVIMAAQLLACFCPKCYHKEKQSKISICGCPIPRVLQQAYQDACLFLFGFCVTDSSSNFIKYSVGRLRPNFMDVCKPDFNCTTAADPYAYIEQFNCTNPDTLSVVDARLSFPSGHSSIAAYSMIFCIIFIHKNLRCSYSAFFKPILQILLFLMAAYTAVSRLGDNKHHVSDIVGGFTLGTVICVCVFQIPWALHEDDYEDNKKGRLDFS